MDFQTLFRRTPATMLLLISFIGLFIIQVATGVDINNPTGQALVTWGANFLPLTINDQPWRLLTSAFLHIGLMHLLFNSFAMFYFGQAVEISFGSLKFVLLFLLCAIGGNLLNAYDTMHWQVLSGGAGLSAGASGGIMGLGMALLMVELLKNSVLNFPTTGDKSQLQSLAVIMGINLVYGFAIDGIDNAGHIGGALTGAILTLGIILGYRYKIMQRSPILRALPWITFILVGVIFIGIWYSLHQQLLSYLPTQR